MNKFTPSISLSISIVLAGAMALSAAAQPTSAKEKMQKAITQAWLLQVMNSGNAKTAGTAHRITGIAFGVFDGTTNETSDSLRLSYGGTR